jgi:hypothetical protein
MTGVRNACIRCAFVALLRPIYLIHAPKRGVVPGIMPTVTLTTSGKPGVCWSRNIIYRSATGYQECCHQLVNSYLVSCSAKHNHVTIFDIEQERKWQTPIFESSHRSGHRNSHPAQRVAANKTWQTHCVATNCRTPTEQSHNDL